MQLTISFRSDKRSIDVEEDVTIQELLLMIENETKVMADMQKLIVPKVGAIKLDSHGDRTVGQVFENEISRSRIILVGTPMSGIEALQRMESAEAERKRKLQKRLEYRLKYGKKPARTAVKPVEYTFGQLIALPHLPNADRSLEMLQRIQDDKGVQAIMAKHKWSVGTLTELDPATNTTHSERLLGLNVGKGAIIKLRLRTDDYQGFCEYKQIIKVLCHELAHNVHSEHDRQFWDLTNQLEKEVIALDPFGGRGHALTDQKIFDPETSLGTGHAEHLHVDGGVSSEGQVLGSSAAGSSNSSGDGNEDIRSQLREAAEQRKKRSR